MQLYAARLADQPGFVVPELNDDLTRERVLAMSFEQGVPIESLTDAPQQTRDAVFERLIRLVARELFEFGVMQTDPNFANYRYRAPESGDGPGQIVLLDFGATRAVAPDIALAYRKLLEAGLAQDHDRIREESVAAGFVNPATVERHRERIDRMIAIIVDEMGRDTPFDFGDRSFVPKLRDEGMEIAKDRASWHLPPAETLFVQRKVSGTALLGARLGAVVNVHALVREVLDQTRAKATSRP